MKQNKVKVLFVLIAVLFVVTVISLAQSTEQSDNECFEGGWMEGTCSTTDVDGDGDVDQQDRDWMFTCGHYMAQVDSGELTNNEVPLEGCEKQEREIPRPEEPKEPKEDPVAICASSPAPASTTIIPIDCPDAD